MRVKRHQHLKSVQTGFSLIETLLIITLLSLTILPYTLMMSQTAQNAKGVYIQSSRTFIMNRLMDEMNPERPSYANDFNQSASMITTLSESGEAIPYRRLVDVTTANASDTLNKTVYFYLYNKQTDSSASPLFKTGILQSTDTYRQRVGNINNLTDSAGNVWFGDNSLYTAADKKPGYVTNMGTTNYTTQPIVNVPTTTDAALYQYYREGTGNVDLNYNFDLNNGVYTVKLYFCEVVPTISTSAPNRRSMDIYLEGAKYNSSAYSPYGTTGGTYRANVQVYNLAVSDGTLNVSVRKSGASDYDARLSGISIHKRTMK